MNVYWIEKYGSYVPYSIGSHLQDLYKFLVMSTPEGNILITGPQNQHRTLMEDAENLLVSLNSPLPRKPVAAGECFSGGSIVEDSSSMWCSSYYGAPTPMEMRPVIIELLGLSLI